MSTFLTVFVSSTFKDLKEERKAVMEHLLHMKCIPLGMEYFNASNDSQWKKITDLIDISDYYVLIIGGRYGSKFDNTGISYTRKEYEYALSKNIPVLTFIISDASKLSVDKVDIGEEDKKALENFKNELKNRIVVYWDNSTNLASSVVLSIIEAEKDCPQPGWVRNKRE